MIPETKSAPKAAEAPTAEAIVADAKAKLDNALEAILNAKKVVDLFYNELAARQGYIDSLTKEPVK